VAVAALRGGGPNDGKPRAASEAPGEMDTEIETLSNPLTGEEVAFLLTAAATGGQRTVVEIRLPPRASGPPAHFHTAFSETFEVLEGELTLRVGDRTARLGEGERLVIPPGCLHTFRSDVDRPVRFRGTIEPGSAEFENCARISFGLAREGFVTRAGVPKRLSHLAVLAAMSQSNLTGLGRVLLPIFRLWARTGPGRDTRRALVRRYCPPGAAGDTP
jgi:mannose-6-phosphate isomerase-like protein (cupin superfamily)